MFELEERSLVVVRGTSMIEGLGGGFYDSGLLLRVEWRCFWVWRTRASRPLQNYGVRRIPC